MGFGGQTNKRHAKVCNVVEVGQTERDACLCGKGYMQLTVLTCVKYVAYLTHCNHSHFSENLPER